MNVHFAKPIGVDELYCTLENVIKLSARRENALSCDAAARCGHSLRGRRSSLFFVRPAAYKERRFGCEDVRHLKKAKMIE